MKSIILNRVSYQIPRWTKTILQSIDGSYIATNLKDREDIYRYFSPREYNIVKYC